MAKKLTTEEIDNLYNKMVDNGMSEEADLFIKDPSSFDFRLLEENPNFTDKYRNVDDFLGNKYKILGDLYKQLDGKKPSKARMESIQEKYPFINREELENWFEKTNKYRADIEAEDKRIEGINRRTREVKEDWDPIKKAIASEYEIQRYINEPEKAIFGKEAPGIVGSSLGAKADLATGLAAGAADLVPVPYISPVGAILRGTRDVGHKIAGSPYQKDWGQIAKDVGTDAALSLGTLGLANTRKAARVASALAPEEVRKAYNIGNEVKAIDKGLDKMYDFRSLSNTEIAKRINQLPESELKSALKAETDGFVSKGINRDRVESILDNYEDVVAPGFSQRIGEMVDQGKTFSNAPKFLETQIVNPPIRGKGNKLMLGALRVSDAINTGKPGYMMFQGIHNVAQRGATPNIIQSVLQGEKANEQKKWYKKEYDRDWRAGFVPNKKEGDPLWEAYKEWKEEND